MPINSFENYPMSWKPVLKKGKEPLYIELAAQLEQDIATGILLPGTKLPPQRELADFLDINVSTVSRAFKICARKGLLSGKIGAGTYVTYGRTTNILTVPEAKGSALIQLGSMVPEVIPQDEMIALLRKMLDEPESGKFFQYSQDIAAWHREAAVKLLTRAGCPADAEQIFFAGGGQNSLAAIFAGLFRPGDKVGVDPLVYPGVKSAAKLFGIRLVPLRQENNEITEEGLRYAIKNDAITGIYVMPDFHNPTMHTMTQQCREMIAETATETDLIVIEDGINSLLKESTAKTIFAAAPEQTIFMLSLSKTINPALRLAYLAVAPRYQHNLSNALYNINLSQSALLTELASRLIMSGKVDSLLARRKEGLERRNRLTDEVLNDYEVWGGAASLSRWLILPSGMTGMQFEQMALKEGVFVYGSERFAVGKDTPIAAARLAICAPETLEELERGLVILKNLLDDM